MIETPSLVERIPAAPRTPARAQVVVAAGLGQHAAAWDEIVAAAPLASPFLRTWWLETVAAADPCYLLVIEDGTLIGGLALQRRRALGVDHLSLLGAGRLCPDHLDLIALPGRAAEVASALRGWFTRPGARVVDLDGLREHAAVLAALPGARETQSATAIYEPLPAEAVHYLKARSKNFRSKVSRSRNRFGREQIVIRQSRPEELPAVLDSFVELHELRPDRAPLLRRMNELRRILAVGTARGEVLIHVAEQQDRCCGVLISFTTGDRLSTYQLARSLDHDLRDIGTMLYVVAIEDACAAGYTELDLLRGDEDYKWSFATRSRPLSRAQAAYGAPARLALTAVRAAESVRPHLGRMLRLVRGEGQR